MTWDHKLGAMNQGMYRICKELLTPSSLFLPETWLLSLDRYITEHDRLLYKSISNYIFDLNDNSFSTFLTNLDRAVEYRLSQSKGPDDGDAARKLRTLLKFYDHVNLARTQFTMFSQKQDDIDRSIKSKLEPALAKSSKELTSQLIGLVAIFTALSFIIFGGISSLGSIFSVLSQRSESILPALIVAVAWAFCLLNLLFAFMYFVLRIINKAPDSINREGNLVQKYPLVFLINYCLLSALLLLLWAWAIKSVGIWDGLSSMALSHKYISCFLPLICVLCIIIILGWALYRRYKQDRTKNS